MKKFIIIVVPILSLFVFILIWLALNELMKPLELDVSFRLFFSCTISTLAFVASIALSFRGDL